MDSGKHLYDLRFSLILTQKEFASRLGYAQGTVTDIERGRIGISTKFLQKIKDVFGYDFVLNEGFFKAGHKSIAPTQIVTHPGSIHIKNGADNSVNACMVEAIALLEDWIKTKKVEVKANLSIDDAEWNAIAKHTLLKVEPVLIKIEARIEVAGYDTFHIDKC